MESFRAVSRGVDSFICELHVLRWVARGGELNFPVGSLPAP